MSQAVLFEHFRHARARKLPVWSVPLFAGCALFTAALLFAMWVKTIWETEQLERPRRVSEIWVAPTPPPPPPPLAGGSKPVAIVIVPKRPTVRVLVQPIRIDHEPPRPSEANPAGALDGQREGTLGGAGDNPDAPITSTEPLPQPAPPQDTRKRPPILPPSVVEASRISGEKS